MSRYDLSRPPPTCDVCRGRSDATSSLVCARCMAKMNTLAEAVEVIRRLLSHAFDQEKERWAARDFLERVEEAGR